MIKQKLKPQILLVELKVNSIKDLEYLPKSLKSRLLEGVVLMDYEKWKNLRKVLCN